MPEHLFDQVSISHEKREARRRDAERDPCHRGMIRRQAEHFGDEAENQRSLGKCWHLQERAPLQEPES